MNRIIHVFQNVDFRNQHTGLSEVMGKVKIKPGEHVIFLNKAQDKVKIMSANGILSYKRSDRGKLDLNVITEIPGAFSADGFNFNKALESALKKKLEKKAIKKVITPKVYKKSRDEYLAYVKENNKMRERSL